MSRPSQAARQLSAHRLAEPSRPHTLARPGHPNGGAEFQLLTLRYGKRRMGDTGREEGASGTLKSDREAISSSSSLVAEEAEIRVCCWLEVTRWGLLISPWLTVMAGLQTGTSQREPQVQPQAPPARPSPPQEINMSALTLGSRPANPEEAH